MLDRNGIPYKCGDSVVFQLGDKVMTGKVLGKSSDDMWVTIKVPKHNGPKFSIHTSHTVRLDSEDATIVLLRGSL